MSQLKIKDGNNWINIPASGIGVPSGGTTGQVLQKSSNTDYATEWANKPRMTFNVLATDITPGSQTVSLSESVDNYDFMIVAIGWGNAKTSEQNNVITPIQYNESEPKVFATSNAIGRIKVSFSGSTATFWDANFSNWDTNGCIRIIGAKIG